MGQAFINNNILFWARERSEKSIDDLAQSLNVKLDKLKQWEAGEAYPTFKQAQSLAKKFHIPFGYLFLKNPLRVQATIPDFRTIGNQAKETFSVDFHEVLSDALRKQAWFKEQLCKEDVSPLPFIGLFSIGDDKKLVARNIQETLEINQELRRVSASWENFLSKLIDQVELHGILVMRNGVVGNNSHRPLDVNEFRGFVLSDPLAPLIFLNNRDAQSAKIFTLVHELVHLWLGESGVSNFDPIKGTDQQTKEIEKFCNAVAAEVLVPEDVILEMWNHDKTIDYNSSALCRYFRVSPLVILIRARDLNLIHQATFKNEYPKYIKRQSKSAQSGGNPFKTLPVRNSKRFTKTLISDTLEGNTLYREAAQLLGVKVDTINSLADHLQMS